MVDDAFPGNGILRINDDYEIIKLRKRIEKLERGKASEEFPGLLDSRLCVRYRFLNEHRGKFGPIRKACETIKVSRFDYYEFLGRRKSNAQIEREALG